MTTWTGSWEPYPAGHELRFVPLVSTRDGLVLVWCTAGDWTARGPADAHQALAAEFLEHLK